MFLQPVDSKREEYRKYLERAGVMATLTRVLVLLYQEQDKGIDALEYPFNESFGSLPHFRIDFLFYICIPQVFH